MSTARILSAGVIAVLALGVQAEVRTDGIVLLQRHVEAMAGETDVDNSSSAHNEMFDALHDMKTMDIQLQRKAREQSEHLATTVAEYSEKLKMEEAKIASLMKLNSELRQHIEEQQSKNNDFRKVLNATKQQGHRLARDLRTFAANLSDTGSDLDVILQENVEMTPARELSALQLEDDAHPDVQMNHLKSSLESIHSEIENGMSEKFNATYSKLLAHEGKLLRDQRKLNISLAFERRQGAALHRQITRLKKLMDTTIPKRDMLQDNVAPLGDVVQLTKLQSEQRAELLLAKQMQANLTAHNASKQSSSADKPTAGLFSRAVQASKAALASAGKKVASVFGGAKAQDKTTAKVKSSQASNATALVNATHKSNPSHKATVAQNASRATTHTVAPVRKTRKSSESLLQRDAVLVATEGGVENSTDTHNEMIDALHEMKAMDFQLQRKARQQSDHLATTVAEYNKTLSTENAKIAFIAKTNSGLRQIISEQQSENNRFRKVLNATRQELLDMARDLHAFAADLSDTGSDLELILKENVELTPPRGISALQLEDDTHPDDQMKHLKSSLESIHSEIEDEIDEKFNATYSELLAHEGKLLREQGKLNMTLAFERRQGGALYREITRLKNLMGKMTEKSDMLEDIVVPLGTAVHESKMKYLKRAELLLAKQQHASMAAYNASQEEKQSSLADASNPGLFGQAVQASKAALASAGKKLASVFGGAKAQDKETVKEKSSQASNVTALVNATHKSNTSHNATAAQNASRATTHTVAPKKKLKKKHAAFNQVQETQKPSNALLQRYADLVAGGKRVDNSSSAHNEMFDALHDMKTMDIQLQRKAREQSNHLATTVDDYSKKLKTQQAKIAFIGNTNNELRQQIAKQQSTNNGFRKELNATKQEVLHVAHDLRTFAANLSDTGSDLELILKDNVELTPPRRISALQLEDDAHPDDQMTHLESSLESIHSEIENEMSEKFNATYSKLLAHEGKLLRDQGKLNITLAFERRQGALLHAEIVRLKKLIVKTAPKRNMLQDDVATLGNEVQHSKLKSVKRAELLLAKQRQASATDASHEEKQSSSADASNPGLFGQAVQASKAALASAGKKVASVFGGAKAREKETVKVKSSQASNATAHVNATHKTNTSNKAHVSTVHKANVSHNVSSAQKAVKSSVPVKKTSP